jgi:hypothetical protein
MLSFFIVPVPAYPPAGSQRPSDAESTIRGTERYKFHKRPVVPFVQAIPAEVILAPNVHLNATTGAATSTALAETLQVRDSSLLCAFACVTTSMHRCTRSVAFVNTLCRHKKKLRRCPSRLGCRQTTATRRRRRIHTRQTTSPRRVGFFVLAFTSLASRSENVTGQVD